jgi:hypothetical protein
MDMTLVVVPEVLGMAPARCGERMVLVHCNLACRILDAVVSAEDPPWPPATSCASPHVVAASQTFEPALHQLGVHWDPAVLVPVLHEVDQPWLIKLDLASGLLTTA